MSACERCLRRACLLAAVSGHLERVRARVDDVLVLGERELIAAVGGRRGAQIARELSRFDAEPARARCAEAGLEPICRCDRAYPPRLEELPSPPAVLHLNGAPERFEALAGADPVAIVGARSASQYGLDVARSLGRGLAAAGVTVVSGMAMGIDSAAHAGALSVGGPTIAVLPGCADRPYPSGRRALHRRLTERGAAVGELPPGTAVRRWMFPARNRLIAALAAMTVVVEAGPRSGALLTAAFALALGRPLGAVPGRISSPHSVGPHELLARGAQIIRGPQDVLDAVFGAGTRSATTDPRPELTSELRRLLSSIAAGHDTAGSLARAGFAPGQGLAGLASLELAGYVRREPGGRFTVLP